jgi:hypothetical protein
MKYVDRKYDKMISDDETWDIRLEIFYNNRPNCREGPLLSMLRENVKKHGCRRRY